MNEQQLIDELRVVFRNLELTDDETAYAMLELLHDNVDTLIWDLALVKAFRELRIWSRTEENTGEVLDIVHDLLNL